MKSCATQRAIGHSFAASGSNLARHTSPFRAHIESNREAQATPVSLTTGKPKAIHSEKGDVGARMLGPDDLFKAGLGGVLRLDRFLNGRFQTLDRRETEDANDKGGDDQRQPDGAASVNAFRDSP